MLTKTAMALIAQEVGFSHEDAKFISLKQSLPKDQSRIRFCPNGDKLTPDTPRSFRCLVCGYVGDRAVTFTPEMRFCIEDGQIIHYSVGAAVFCRFEGEQEKRVLLLRRATHPVGAFTIPSGHWDVGEDAIVSAQREVEEETGIMPPIKKLIPVSTNERVEEECRSGSNIHIWQFYRYNTTSKAADLKLPGDHKKGRVGEADMIGWIPVSQVKAGIFWLTRPAGHFLAKALDLKTRIPHVLPR